MRELKCEEKRMANSIVERLRKVYPCVQWGIPEEEPPDICLFVTDENGVVQKWGVGITAQVMYTSDDRQKTLWTAQAAAERVARDLSSKLPPDHAFGYTLVVDAAKEIDWRKVNQMARAYIKRGEYSRQELAPGIEFVRSGTTKCVLGFAMFDGNLKIPGTNAIFADIMASLKFSAKKTIEDKAEKLKKVVGYDRVLVAIWPGYLFVTADRMLDALKDVPLAAGVIDAILFDDSDLGLVVVADPSGINPLRQ